ncbi:MAG: hypothetical protein M1821_004706 [Bathelium mastoideum]|nr:MAG: hypothetical protein M1821_004706 [Bathelium mastoideum]
MIDFLFFGALEMPRIIWNETLHSLAAFDRTIEDATPRIHVRPDVDLMTVGLDPSDDTDLLTRVDNLHYFTDLIIHELIHYYLNEFACFCEGCFREGGHNAPHGKAFLQLAEHANRTLRMNFGINPDLGLWVSVLKGLPYSSTNQTPCLHDLLNSLEDLEVCPEHLPADIKMAFSDAHWPASHDTEFPIRTDNIHLNQPKLLEAFYKEVDQDPRNRKMVPRYAFSFLRSRDNF